METTEKTEKLLNFVATKFENEEIVYFITDNNYVKIGYTKNLKQRFINHQVSNPNELFLLKYIFGDIKLESKIHNLFSEYIVRGEWFLLPDNWIKLLSEELPKLKRELKNRKDKENYDLKKEELKCKLIKRTLNRRKRVCSEKLNTLFINNNIIKEPILFNNEIALGILKIIDSKDILKTIPNYSKSNNMSYNGVKKFRNIIELFNVKFVIDND